MASKQLSIFDESSSAAEKRAYRQRLIHGGATAKGRRKLRRPLATKKWMHLILKSKKATGKYWMLNQSHARAVEKVVQNKARKFGVEIKDFVNMGNHIHFQIRVASRASFQGFLRAIANLIARMVTGAKRGKKFGKFWDGLAFTRIITTFQEQIGLEGYIISNKVERKHGYKARQIYLQALNAWIKKLKTNSELYLARVS